MQQDLRARPVDEFGRKNRDRPLEARGGTRNQGRLVRRSGQHTQLAYTEPPLMTDHDHYPFARRRHDGGARS